MDQAVIGQFIAKKRKEKNLTQEQLAEKIGVSNKSVSKWECGKCMPDYSLVEPLCRELGISIAELMDGETGAQGSIRSYDDEQILEMLAKVQHLETQKNTLIGIVLIVMGIALLALSQTIDGSGIRDFIAGVTLGLSVGEMMVGVYIVARSFAK